MWKHASSLHGYLNIQRQILFTVTQAASPFPKAVGLISFHLSLNRDRWGTTDDFANRSLHFPCSPLPAGTWLTPGLSILWCCLPTSSSVYLVFFPLSPCLASWFWPDLMNGRHDHTTAVCVSLRWSGGLHVVWLSAGSWHWLPCW